MNDDWRLKIDLHEHGFARRLAERLAAEELEHDLARAFKDRAIVSVEGTEVFCYTGTRDQAQRAENLVRQLAASEGWQVDIELAHWHPVAEQWEDPDAPLPADPAQEREDRVEHEREESAEQGYPELEVRVQCASRADASELSDRLRSEDVPHLHRWSYVLIGATDEDSAEALAQRLRTEAPAGSEVTVERNRRAIYDNRLWSAFTVLGGLGG